MRYLIALLFVVGLHAQTMQQGVTYNRGQFRFIQAKDFNSGGTGTGGSACAASTNTCTVAVSTIGAGHSLIALFVAAVDATAPSISAINGETWTHCSTCTFGNTTGNGYVDASYVLSATGGEGSFTFTFSNATAGFTSVAIFEYAYSGKSVSFDTSGGANTASSASPAAGVALALSAGANHVILQASITISATSGFTGVGYTSPAYTNHGTGSFAGIVNASVGTAPTWTVAGSGSYAVTTAIALKGN